MYSDNEHKNMVIIYGGYNAPPGTFTYAISDQILLFDYLSQSWTVLKNTKVPLFRHSASLINGIMIVIGGNGHNESNPSAHTDCYSSTIYAFDVSCQEWFPIKVKENELLARYGHVAVTSDDHVFVIGGFNGRMLNDVVRFKPADCKAIRDPEKCRLMKDGTKCIYVAKQCTRVQPFVSYASTFSLSKNEEVKGGPTCGISQRKYGYSCGERKDYPTDCKVQKTCSECQLVGPGCGWCDDGTGTGLGACLHGSESSPRNATMCAAERWYYTGQPKCQCNGHSTCDAKGKCNCGHNTIGPNCGTCAPGFFGEPENGGQCKKCDCYDPDATCNPQTGDCYCTAKGVTGTKCEKCEPKYYGDPKNGKPCLYDLAVDFIFTFKIDTDEVKDKYVKEINFFSIPTKKDTDVQFTIVCEGESGAKVSINMTSSVFEGHPGHTQRTLAPTRCDKNGLRRTYVPSDPLYPFGTDTNTTFLVKVDSFTTPIKIQISFAQSPPINWVLFFVIFAACFIVLLVVAGLLWMIKLRVEVYRRNQRRYDEIEQMASRPFASVRLELASHERNPMATPISVEPLSNYRYGIYTLAVRLPTGGKQFTPHGTSGLAVASALCLLNQSQLAVLQAPDSSESGRNRKHNFRRFIPFMRS
ncbi:hypothetical protein QR680_001776 [Steinernema hermaphroditum]|uniref:Laminin EGF-like domain-containing protein n=1 Tax=Steinernema hermaphroditum TaxID=289476 RepID=A0AA39GZT1_9BILA|nr:hypothetical protein QR680_001776 [Steinernema hermaphroditum]